MTDGLDLITEELAAGDKESVERRRGTHVEIPTVHIVESADCIRDLTLVLFVPRLLGLAEQHDVGKVETGRQRQVVEEGEVGLDGYLVVHTVRPVARHVRVEHLVLLRADLVLQVTRIAHRDLLVPALRTNGLLTFEGVEARDTEVDIGQFQREGRVTHVLIDTRGGGDVQTDAREVDIIGH